MSDFKQKALQQRRDALVEEYEAVSKQLGYAPNAADRLRLERQLESLDSEIDKVENELKGLGVSAGATRPHATSPVAGGKTGPVEAFFSYAHKDARWRERLEAHLAQLQREEAIAGWHDGRITPGQEWDKAIKAHLESARVVLLLVSANFLASDYIDRVELKRALKRHEAGDACVIPIILSDCDWHSAPFGKLQALPQDAVPIRSRKWRNVDEPLADVARGIRRAIESL